jgi:hypothetical protein
MVTIITSEASSCDFGNPLILGFLILIAALGFTLSLVWRLKWEKQRDMITKLKEDKK